MRLRVCDVDDVPTDGMKAFVVDGLSAPVLLGRIDGILVATTSICPHEDVSLADDNAAVNLSGTRITCGAHGYCFDVATGACEHDPELQLRRFRVECHNSEVFIDVLHAP